MPDKVHFLCSCPDYLHGTGKPTKKKTTCKQCKGIKLPFAPIGGTVRMIATPYCLDPAIMRNCVGTVRLSSSGGGGVPFGIRQRPTILCGDHDPYDMLRQSRLMYGDRSPVDGPEMQSPYQAMVPATAIPANGMTSLLRMKRLPTAAKSPSRIIDSFASLVPDAYCARSILPSTPVNPYELISSTLHNNEFAPGSSLFDMLSHGDRITDTEPCRTIAIRTADRSRMPEVNVLSTFAPHRSQGRECADAEAAAAAAIHVTVQPPPLPAVESLPLSVKTVSDRFTKNVDALKKAAATSSRSATCAAKYKSILKQSAGMVPKVNGLRVDAMAKEPNGNGSTRIRCIDIQPMPSTGNAITHNTVPLSQHLTADMPNQKMHGSRPKFATMRSSDFKTIIKDPRSVRIVSGTATTGRLKKVQFNTEPMLARPKTNNTIAEYDEVCSDTASMNEPFYVNVNVSRELSAVPTTSDASNDESTDIGIKFSKCYLLSICEWKRRTKYLKRNHSHLTQI